MKTTFCLVAVFATGSALAAGNDPRLDQALSTNLIANAERSVQFEKTIPAVKPAKPPAPEGVQLAEDVYVDRALMPQRSGGDEKAIRVSPRDRR